MSADYATLFRSDETASLEAALSFLSDCDDGVVHGGSGHHHVTDAATWRLLQDANSHDLDVDIVETHDDNDDADADYHATRHALHAHLPHMTAYKRSMSSSGLKAEHLLPRDDDADDEMLSALLEAEHLPVMETISTGASNSSSSHHHTFGSAFHDAAHASGYASHNVNAFAHSAAEYKPQHNPGMMMAMMSAGFPTIDFNPQSLLMTPAHDGSASPQSSTGSPTAAGTAGSGAGSPTTAAASGSATSPPSGRRSSASSATSSSALVKKRPSKKKPAGYNSNRARDERKEELIYLRKTVLEMETRLSKLKQNAPATDTKRPTTTTAAGAPSFSPTSSSSSTASSSASSSASAKTSPVKSGGSGRTTATTTGPTTAQQQQQLSNSVWEDIATRQYKERRRAELENIRLKLILEGQIKMAKALEKILKKRTSLRILESVRGGGKRVKCVHRPGSNDAAIFEELLAGVAKTLEEVDGVFEANGLGRMQTAYRDAQLRHDDVNGMVMEIFANKVMPFDMQATASAVWRHYAHSMEHMPSRSHYQKQPPYLETTDDTLVESYGLELHGSRTKGNFLCKQIMRKFEQSERIVIGWRAQAEAVDLSAEPTAGIRLVERGYTVIKELANMATPHTLVQTCYIIRPHVYDEIADQERKVGALTDFILNCVAGTISASHQMIENFLLDQALKTKA